MKLRIADRILVALAGLLILALCAAIIAQTFFQVDLVGKAAGIFSSDAAEVRVALGAAALLLLLLGGYCFFVLFRHRRRRDKFILQKNDAGELNISIKALENMVSKCLDQHPEISIQQMYLQNEKDGLLIRLRGSAAGGISIPLSVEAIQRQIKQYVTACSGVEIKNIAVQIEASGPEAENAPFRIMPPAQPLLNEESQNSPGKAEAEAPSAAAAPAEAAEAPEQAPEQAPAAPAPAPALAPIPQVPAAPEEEDDRPLHQRLFSTQEEPCIVPAPPAEELTEEAAPAAEAFAETIDEAVPAAEEAAEDIAEDIAEAAPAAEEAAEDIAEAVPAAEEAAGDLAEAADEAAEAEEDGADSEERKAAREAFLAAQGIFDSGLTDKPAGEDQE